MKQIIKKHKVLIVGPLPPPYIGPTLATEVIMSSTLNTEFDLCHLDTSDHRGIETLGRIDFWNIYLPIKHYIQLVLLIIRKRPDLIYIPISQTTLGYLKDAGFIFISKFFRKKVLCHLRGGNFKNWLMSSSKLTNSLVRKIHKLVDGQIVLGERLKEMFSGVIPEDKLYVVYNGKDIEVSRNNKYKGKTLKVLFLSNLIRSKGLMDVVHSIKQTVNSHPDVEFQFAGVWYEQDLKKEFDVFVAMNPELPIKLLGEVSGESKSQVLSQADIFVFPTYYPPEGHPWVIIEAMAYGLPVISTDHAAIPETVCDGINGFIVEKENPAEISNRLLVLLKEDKLRERFGEASRDIYKKRFTEVEMIRQFRQAINTVLKSGQSS